MLVQQDQEIILTHIQWYQTPGHGLQRGSDIYFAHRMEQLLFVSV